MYKRQTVVPPSAFWCLISFLSLTSHHRHSHSLANQSPLTTHSFTEAFHRFSLSITMRVSTLSFMAAAHVASAQFLNTTTTATPSATSSSQGVAPTSPASVGPFQKYGCASLENGLSGLDVVTTNDEMTLELCASTCFEINGTPGFGVIGA